MEEITYSQDVIINDRDLLATLCVFCKNIWLPYNCVAQDLHEAASKVTSQMKEDPSKRLLESHTERLATEKLLKNLTENMANDPEKDVIVKWISDHAVLFSDGGLKTLPVSMEKEHQHRYLNNNTYDNTYEFFERKYEGIEERGITARLALAHHFIRDDLPGVEFFEGSKQSTNIELIKSIFFMEIPQISANDEQICELRHKAQRKNIKQFWEMIEEQQRYAGENKEGHMQRGEKIRKEFIKWVDAEMIFRGKSVAVGGVVALCFVDSTFTPFATFAAASWLGELNKWWVQRKDSQHKAFKFMSRIHGRIRKLSK